MSTSQSATPKGHEQARGKRASRPPRARTLPQDAERDRLRTIVFESEAEYVRFTDYVYEQYAGAGLELTDVPIATSIRVRTWLLERTRDQFALRPVTPDDLAQARERLGAGRAPWEPSNLDDFSVPGIPRREPAR